MITQKLPNAAAAVLTIGATATNLLEAIRTASSDADFEFIDGVNSVTLLVTAKDIYYRVDGNAADSTNGILLYEGQSINLAPIEIGNLSMIRSTTDATVKIIQIAKKKQGEI